VQSGWLRYVAAASVILLVGSTILIFIFSLNTKHIFPNIYRADRKSEPVGLANQNLQTKLQNYESMMDMIRDTAMAM